MNQLKEASIAQTAKQQETEGGGKEEKRLKKMHFNPPCISGYKAVLLSSINNDFLKYYWWEKVSLDGFKGSGRKFKFSAFYLLFSLVALHTLE